MGRWPQAKAGPLLLMAAGLLLLLSASSSSSTAPPRRLSKQPSVDQPVTNLWYSDRQRLLQDTVPEQPQDYSPDQPPGFCLPLQEAVQDA